jgi:hypothetical protein
VGRKARRAPGARGPVSDDLRGGGRVAATITDLGAAREHRAWANAVGWLHGLGLPAAAPCEAAGYLSARGLDADWYYRGPCGCGSAGCWVLACDGGRLHDELHLPVIALTGTGAP